jgi:hypothetical protein
MFKGLNARRLYKSFGIKGLSFLSGSAGKFRNGMLPKCRALRSVPHNLCIFDTAVKSITTGHEPPLAAVGYVWTHDLE